MKPQPRRHRGAKNRRAAGTHGHQATWRPDKINHWSRLRGHRAGMYMTIQQVMGEVNGLGLIR